MAKSFCQVQQMKCYTAYLQDQAFGDCSLLAARLLASNSQEHLDGYQGVCCCFAQHKHLVQECCAWTLQISACQPKCMLACKAKWFCCLLCSLKGREHAVLQQANRDLRKHRPLLSIIGGELSKL